jgi:hypothetical protein
MIGPFDKPAELQIQPIPFELMFQLAEKQQARRDKSEQELGTLQGAFASLQEAPGHEDYKRKALSPYQDAIKNFMSKYSDPSDPRAIRELSALKSSFMSDPHIQNIHNSKQTYDKLMPELYKAKQTDAVFTSPVMNKQGEFQPNEQLYTPSNLGFIPNEGKFDEEMDTIIRAKLPEMLHKNQAGFTTIKDSQGNPREVFIEGGKEVSWRDSNTFKSTIQAAKNIASTQSTGSSKWFVNKYGEDMIEPYLWNRTEPLMFNHEKRNINYQFPAKGEEKAGAELFEQAQPFEYISGEQKSLDEIKNSKNIIESSPTQFPIMGGGMGSSGNIQHTVRNPGTTAERFGNLSKTTQYALLDIAKKIGIAQVPSQWTEENWNKLEVELSKRKPIRVAPISMSYRNPTYVSTEGETIDNNLENNVFYDPQEKQVYSGVQLRKAGWQAVGKTGYLSSYNVTSIQVPGTNNKASFASPDIVKLKNADGTTKTMYMGINKSQINDQYIKDLVKNKISVAAQIKYPTQLLEGDDSVIILPFENPKQGNPKYSFKLGIEGYDTPFEFEASTQADYDKMVGALVGPNPTDSNGSTLPGIRNFIITSLFND